VDSETSTRGGADLGSEQSVARGVEVLARRAVGGRLDATVVLTLRAVRRLWLPSLVLGLAWLVVLGQADAVDVADLNSITELLAALLSPLAGLALAVAIRLVTGVLGTVAALPRAWAELTAVHAARAVALRHLSDLVFLTGALRSLRLTAAARDVAASRYERWGRAALLVDRVETWLVPVSVVLFFVATALWPEGLGS
jgi:hypothetical protein